MAQNTSSAVMAQRSEPHDSLDDFPTPPWATRALIKRVIWPNSDVQAAGYGLKRNPGVACVWVTRSYKLFRPHAGNPGILFALGAPEKVLWFAEGREATRDEVMASIDSGYPALKELADQEGAAAVVALQASIARAMPLLPAGL